MWYTHKRQRDLDTDSQKKINGLNINKSNSHTGISTRMLKLCYSAITKSLSIILQICLKQGFFPKNWKNGNIIPKQ